MKRLGLDLGTNSIGWAIVDYKNGTYNLLNKGVNIFKDGVEHGKSGETPMVQTRTTARALRRHYFRRRLRKIELLEVLVANNLCPKIPQEALNLWKSKKKYPMLPAFIEWQRTDDDKDDNPYHDRNRCLNEILDLEKEGDRFCLGRALYHLNQRRGFISNRKEGTKEGEGNVKGKISELSEKMKSANCNYIGEYFYKLYKEKGKIRTTYTSRIQHVRAEFDAICTKQGLAENLIKDLERAIFYQRPLKSQKGQVGNCTFEKGKKRCPTSHPNYEKFRMLCFLNNIKVQTKADDKLRFLSADEVAKVIPKFYRKSKANFDFEDLAKALVTKKEKYAYYKDDKKSKAAEILFNYRMDTNVSGCPVTASLMEIFGDDWENGICSLYVKGECKSKQDIINDVWHVLQTFDDDDRLEQWAIQNLQLTQEQAKLFVKILMPQDYASLSLNAINKMLPFLENGYRYDQSVFFANLCEVLPKDIWQDNQLRNEIISHINTIISNYDIDPLFRLKEGKTVSKQQYIKEYLQSKFGVDDLHADHLYHPSMIETYPEVKPNKQGQIILGSPRIPALKNPMAMRALFRLRHLINQLIANGEVNQDTVVNIEIARELNDANMRRAIETYQREKQKEHDRIAQEIKNLGFEPTEDDILKYQLWEEQKHICIYTGKEIGVTDFLGANPKFDIEHTIPRSLDGDDSQKNKTLCDSKFNREVKIGKIPYELSNHADILARIESMGWSEEINRLEVAINVRKKNAKMATTKEVKDNAISSRHYLKMRLDYLKGKLETFTIDCVNEGFTNRQGVNIGIIGKYARLYLKTVFNKIHVVKGATTADFRKAWGLQQDYEKKERVNHAHHCIDAITIACIGKREYDNWKQFTEDQEKYYRKEGKKPSFEKPWDTFTEDVKSLTNELLIHHFQPDNMGKCTKKKLRVRGAIQYGEDGKPIYQQGASARGSLHLESFYGAIQREDSIKYVIRKSLASLGEKDIKNIVDDAVREKVEEAIKKFGFKDAVSGENPIWFNEEKNIPIKKVRLYTPSLTKPIVLKDQRDKSNKEYKGHYYVDNDVNYCIAFYEGFDEKSRLKRGYKLVKNIEAFTYGANIEKAIDKSNKGLPLKYILKSGLMVLFYEGTPDELYQCTKVELQKRLYKITGVTINPTPPGYGKLTLKHHLEAREAKALKAKDGSWKQNEEYRPLINIIHTQFNFLVQGYDFDFTLTGEIKFK